MKVGSSQQKPYIYTNWQCPTQSNQSWCDLIVQPTNPLTINTQKCVRQFQTPLTLDMQNSIMRQSSFPPSKNLIPSHFATLLVRLNHYITIISYVIKYTVQINQNARAKIFLLWMTEFHHSKWISFIMLFIPLSAMKLYYLCRKCYMSYYTHLPSSAKAPVQLG